MKCLKCGNEINEGEKFCSECGNKIETQSDINETNQNTTNTTPKKKTNWISTIIVIIVMGCIIAMRDTGNTSNSINVFNTPLNITELTPATVNQNVLIPETTQELSCGELNFALPSTYSYKETTDKGLLIYQTDNKDNETSTFGIISFESDVDGKTLLESMEDSDFQLDNYIIESSSEIKSDILNGVTWYSKIVQQRSIDSSVNMYNEYYYAYYNGKLYYISLGIGVEGKNIDISRSNEFSNIKNSLKFN